MRHPEIARTLTARREAKAPPTFPLLVPDPEPEINFDAPPPVPGALPKLASSEASMLARKLGLPAPLNLGYGLWGLVENVTPIQAEQWLVGHNSLNRNLTEGHAERISGDIEDGRWLLTHQGIAFRADGQLQDGQHRLWAIIESGTPALLFIALNITDQARMAIDSGKGRRPADVAALQGLDIDDRAVSTVRAAVRGLAKDHILWSNQEALKIVQDHAEVLAWLTPRTFKFPAPVKAAILRAWYHVDIDRLDEFVSIITTGARRDGTLTKDDGTATALYRWLGSEVGTTRRPGSHGTRSPETATRVYGKTCRAIEAWFAGEVFERFPVPTREIYTLPSA